MRRTRRTVIFFFVICCVYALHRVYFSSYFGGKFESPHSDEVQQTPLPIVEAQNVAKENKRVFNSSSSVDSHEFSEEQETKLAEKRKLEAKNRLELYQQTVVEMKEAEKNKKSGLQNYCQYKPKPKPTRRPSICYLVLSHSDVNWASARVLLEKLWEPHYYFMFLLEKRSNPEVKKSFLSYFRNIALELDFEGKPVYFTDSQGQQWLKENEKDKTSDEPEEQFFKDNLLNNNSIGWGVLNDIRKNRSMKGERRNRRLWNVGFSLTQFAGWWGSPNLAHNTLMGFRQLWNLSSLCNQSYSPPSPYHPSQGEKVDPEELKFQQTYDFSSPTYNSTVYLPHADSPCSHFLLLSGDSFPLLSNTDIENRLQRNGHSVINREGKFHTSSFRFEGRSKHKPPPPGFTNFWYGGQWATLHRGFAKLAFFSKESDSLVYLMRKIPFDIADESYFPTMYHLFLERKGLMKNEVVSYLLKHPNRHLCRLEVWTSGILSPSVLSSSDPVSIGALTEGPQAACLFGRKFQFPASAQLFRLVMRF